MDRDLVGVWRLVSWEWVDSAGAAVRPLGESPEGYIVCTADGFYSANFVHQDRPNFASDVIFEATGDEWAAAARSYVSLMGQYRVDGGVPACEVDISLFPNWVGAPRQRRYAVEDDRLTLTSLTPVPVAGAPRTAIARLERVRF